MSIAYEGMIDLKDSTETCPVDEQLAYKLKKSGYKNKSSEETKSIPAICVEERYAASDEQATLGQF
ncbi:hypothetical protein T01_11117 [Trichinella spiralis]|uniref:Uncharacterized protein n=1 Tax=Trichinella spiralis TaxID=6334 RepID=A0A0V1BN16_TRISP|nr:hypothetical protein T01_11117 [Trichinella spiralis]